MSSNFFRPPNNQTDLFKTPSNLLSVLGYPKFLDQKKVFGYIGEVSFFTGRGAFENFSSFVNF